MVSNHTINASPASPSASAPTRLIPFRQLLRTNTGDCDCTITMRDACATTPLDLVFLTSNKDKKMIWVWVARQKETSGL